MSLVLRPVSVTPEASTMLSAVVPFGAGLLRSRIGNQFYIKNVGVCGSSLGSTSASISASSLYTLKIYTSYLGQYPLE
jgi:hypothetical protein